MEETLVSSHVSKQLRAKLERQNRLRIIMAVVPFLLGIGLLYMSDSLSDVTYYKPIFFKAIGLTMLAIAAMSLIMTYLQTGFKKQTVNSIEYSQYDNELRNINKKIENERSISKSELEQLQAEIEKLRNDSNTQSNIHEAITEEKQDELLKLLKKELIEKGISSASEEFIKEINDRVKENFQLSSIERTFENTIQRLYSEINALTRRGNLNLAFGIFTTIIGLLILGYFVVEIDSIPEDKVAFIAHFIPRLSLVILIEVFAFFFLRLYKSSLSEIKYFQNEMTNIESRLSAIKCSLMTSDSKSTSAVIIELSSTERNAILNKGQTTAEIEKYKIEQQNISSISTKVASLIGANNAPNK